MEIRLGPAGSPEASTLEGISAVKKLGLQAMEVEFVRGVKMSNELAKKVGKQAEKLDIELSVHGPYYINLASDDRTKIEQSKKRILDSCERGHYMGAKHIVFHAAYYGKRDKEEVYEMVKESVLDIMNVIEKNKWDVIPSPETTGKISQWGELDEVIRLVKETGCGICVDFAHIYARNRGVINYREILDKLSRLGRKKLHCHFSNITYTLKGERMHLNLDGKPPFEPLAREILKRKISATIISESPVTWKDSLKMKRIFEKLGYRF
ncbi:MAG: endonuclease IV [Candidatus Aenigmatarchaeota archaeon]|nr:MAG: endonuclease IV [Candidatus Aenigmarchaeota archaeon]